MHAGISVQVSGLYETSFGLKSDLRTVGQKGVRACSHVLREGLVL